MRFFEILDMFFVEIFHECVLFVQLGLEDLVLLREVVDYYF